MKTKLITAVCAVALLAGQATPCAANEANEPLIVIADAVVVRPACLVATVIGSAFFVVCLPAALISKSVKHTADTLVVRPAEATFTRPLGDMDALLD